MSDEKVDNPLNLKEERMIIHRKADKSEQKNEEKEEDQKRDTGNPFATEYVLIRRKPSPDEDKKQEKDKKEQKKEHPNIHYFKTNAKSDWTNEQIEKGFISGYPYTNEDHETLKEGGYFHGVVNGKVQRMVQILHDKGGSKLVIYQCKPSRKAVPVVASVYINRNPDRSHYKGEPCDGKFLAIGDNQLEIECQSASDSIKIRKGGGVNDGMYIYHQTITLTFDHKTNRDKFAQSITNIQDDGFPWNCDEAKQYNNYLKEKKKFKTKVKKVGKAIGKGCITGVKGIGKAIVAAGKAVANPKEYIIPAAGMAIQHGLKSTAKESEYGDYYSNYDQFSNDYLYGLNGKYPQAIHEQNGKQLIVDDTFKDCNCNDNAYVLPIFIGVGIIDILLLFALILTLLCCVFGVVMVLFTRKIRKNRQDTKFISICSQSEV
eukprot:181565_1